MRILYIDHYAGSPWHGMEYRPHYLARHWVRMGHEVLIAAASEAHVRSKSPVVTAPSAKELVGGIPYLWLKTPRYSGNGIGRVRNMVSFVTGLYRERRGLFREFRPDVVIASSTYTWDIYPAHAIALDAGARLVYEVHDLWPLSPIELGGMSRWHPFIMSLQWAEDYACRHADVVVSLLPRADLHLREHGMHPDKFRHIPNGIELEEWQADDASLPPAHERFLAERRRDGRFLIGFLGSHGLSYSLDTLLDVAQTLSGTSADFVLVGKGDDKERLRQRSLRMGLRNVHFLDPVPKPSVPALLRAMDGLFIGWKKHPLYRFGICPNKLMDYMAAGKPIINAADAPNDSVQDAQCGLSVRAEDADAIADAVIRLLGMPAEQRERMGRAGMAYVHANHDYAVLAKKFLDAVAG